jgi:hypothetical protein
LLERLDRVEAFAARDNLEKAGRAEGLARQWVGQK